MNHLRRLSLSLLLLVLLTQVTQAQPTPVAATESQSQNDSSAAKVDIGITSDPLPIGFRAKVGTKTLNDVEWVLMKVWNPGKRNLRGEVFIEKRAMPTHADRLAATKGYIGGLFSSMNEQGFKPVDAQVPDLPRADFRGRTLLQFRFENEQKNSLLCGTQIWFDDSAGYCGSIISAANTSRKHLLEWLGSLKSKPKPKPSRTWTSLAGDQIQASLVSATLKQAKLVRENGSSINVPITQLSKADQAYLRKSPLRTQVYSDSRHPAQTLIPAGYAQAPPIHKEATSYRHLNGCGIHFQVLGRPEASNDLAGMLSQVGKLPGDTVTTLANTRIPVVTAPTPKPINGIAGRYYLTAVGDNLLLVVCEAREQELQSNRALFDSVMQTMRVRK